MKTLLINLAAGIILGLIAAPFFIYTNRRF